MIFTIETMRSITTTISSGLWTRREEGLAERHADHGRSSTVADLVVSGVGVPLI